MSNIWFTSDTHFGHKNICRGVSKWDNKENTTRDFNTVEEMNQAIVKGINRKVKYDDTLYHLGDWSFGGISKIYEFWKQLECKNIHLILGNHDHHIEENNEIYTEQSSILTHDLFKSVQHTKEINVNGTMIFMSHYSHRVWNKSHKGTIHLYGHSHGTLENFPHGKSMDVGIDSYYRSFKKYEPFHIDEIRTLMKDREIKMIDHHNSNTNN